MKSEFGLIGLGVMGKSLARNLASRGFRISLYNRKEPHLDEQVAKSFIAEHPVLHEAAGFDDLEAFVASLQRPAKVMITAANKPESAPIKGERMSRRMPPTKPMPRCRYQSWERVRKVGMESGAPGRSSTKPRWINRKAAMATNMTPPVISNAFSHPRLDAIVSSIPMKAKMVESAQSHNISPANPFSLVISHLFLYLHVLFLE